MADDPIREDPVVEAFVNTARRYCALLEGQVRDRDLWLADILAALATLYAAAPMLRELALPEEGGDIPAEFRMSNEEWTRLYRHLSAALTGEAAREPGADLADDLADIYRDIKPGLLAWNTEDDRYLEDVLFQWVHYGYVHHWGRHAVEAMRTLHGIVYK